MSQGDVIPIEDHWEVRPANLDDWPIITDLNRRLAVETEGKELDFDTVSQGVRTLLTNPQHGHYFVVSFEGRLIGQIMHTREWSDWRNGEIWWLQSVYVVSEYRRRGVFRALFDHLRNLAQSTPNVIGLRLYVEEHNDRARQTYENLDLTQAGYVVMEHIFRNGV